MFNESAQKLTVYFGKEDEIRSTEMKSMDEIQHKQYSVKSGNNEQTSELDLDQMVKSPTGISKKAVDFFEDDKDDKSKKFRRSVFSKENVSNKKNNLSGNNLMVTGDEDIIGSPGAIIQGS